MKNNILFLICMLLCPLGKTFARVETPEWQSQYAIGLNKLAPHAYVWPYKEGDINSVRAQDYEQSPYYMSLNGTWKFNWVRNPDKRPVNFTVLTFIPVAGMIYRFRGTGNARIMVSLYM